MTQTQNNSINKKIIQLSLPMAGTQLITVGSGFLCMTMLAKLGHDVLAASALIFSISMSVMVIGMSLLFSLSILVGRAYGANDPLKIGCLVQQGWSLAFFISIPILFIFWYIEPILIFLGQKKALAEIVQSFFHANVWRVAPLLLSVCNQQLCYGVHKQKLDMLTNILGIIVLLVIAYILIFGKWGMPVLGVAGLGYAMAAQSCFYFCFTTLWFYFSKDFQRFELFHYRVHQNLHLLFHLFKIGWPISLQVSGEMLSFLASATLIGWLGINSLAAYQVVTQYLFLLVIPVFSISQASGILISQAYGRRQFVEIQKLGYGSIRIALFLSILMGLIFILFPKALASMYIDVNNAQNNETVHLIILLFAMMALAQLFDTVRNVLIGSLRGLFDTRFPMFIAIFVIWLIGMPLSYLLAFNFHLGAAGVVLGWTIGMFVGALIMIQRFSMMTSKINLLNFSGEF